MMNSYQTGIIIGAGTSDASKIRVYRSTISDEAVEALDITKSYKSFADRDLAYFDTKHETDWPSSYDKDFIRGFFSTKKRMNVCSGIFFEYALSIMASKKQIVGLTEFFLSLGLNQFSVWPTIGTKGGDTLPYRFVIDDEDSIKRFLDYLGDDTLFYQQALR